jgi:prephenate dehydrogenase
VLFNKVAIVGMGLLGGSLGRALREFRVASCVAGYARRQATLEECRQVGAADLASTDLAEVVNDAEVVVLCTPIGQMGELASQCIPLLRDGTLLTDVGSAKASVVAAIEPLVEGTGVTFVGGHPMAGSEQTGVLASKPDLYVHARCVLTPTPRSPAPSVARLHALWQSVGGRTVEMTPGNHDDWVARASHLPQVLASVLAHHVLDPAHPAGVRDLCATGFKDTSRLASGSPEMWRDIALSNSDAIRAAIESWRAELTRFEAALARKDAGAVDQFLRESRDRREAWLREFRSPSPESTTTP